MSITIPATVDVWLPGVVRPAPRPRVAGGRAYMPGWYGRQKTLMARELAGCCEQLAVAPTRVEIEVILARPASHLLRSGLPRAGAPGWPPARAGDVDNLAKAVLDAMVDARVLPDDSQVVRLVVSKRYGAMDEPCGLRLRAGRV